METPALCSMLEARIKIKLEEIEAQERKLSILRIELGNDVKVLQGIINYAKEYGFIRD